MTLEEVKNLPDGTTVQSNGSLGIKVPDGIVFPNDEYFDGFDILDDVILKDCKPVKCYLIAETDYTHLLEILEDIIS